MAVPGRAGFGDRRRAKEAEHQAALDRAQAAFVTGLLERLDRGAPMEMSPWPSSTVSGRCW
jgi:hypothetical protein